MWKSKWMWSTFQSLQSWNARTECWDASPTLITVWSAESERFPKIHHGKLKSGASPMYCFLLFPPMAEGDFTKPNFLPVAILEALCLHWCNIIHCHVKPLPCLQPLSCPTIYIWNDCSHSQAVSLSINSISLCHPLADLSIPLSVPCCLYLLSQLIHLNLISTPRTACPPLTLPLTPSLFALLVPLSPSVLSCSSSHAIKVDQAFYCSLNISWWKTATLALLCQHTRNNILYA